MTVIETDYLVIGAGAAGMAFTDALTADSPSDVVIVDRRDRPGGHWNDAYPFVRLHAPSTSYGVNSRGLGRDRIDTDGPNAGFYERATGAEICDYYFRVLEEHLLPSGRVRFFGECNYVGHGSGGHQFVSDATGKATTVRVRCKVVDATYLEVAIPATHTPSFQVDDGVRFIPPGEMLRMSGSASGYTVLGAGKTAMDACCWLLDNGVEPDSIRWIRPRDAWMFDRTYFQPRDLVATLMEGFSLGVEAAANCEDVEDLFARQEACGLLARLDPTVQPTMFKGAITSAAERESLRRIERIIRRGRVKWISAERIVLEEGSVPTDRDQIHVDCTADGLRPVPTRPIFEPARITMQSMTTGLIPFNSALIGFVEATREDAADKNRLCRPVVNPSRAVDWLTTMHAFFTSQNIWSSEPDVAAWVNRSRLNLTHGMEKHMTDPRLQSAIVRMASNMQPALAKLEQLIGEPTASGA